MRYNEYGQLRNVIVSFSIIVCKFNNRGTNISACKLSVDTKLTHMVNECRYLPFLKLQL